MGYRTLSSSVHTNALSKATHGYCSTTPWDASKGSEPSFYELPTRQQLLDEVRVRPVNVVVMPGFTSIAFGYEVRCTPSAT